jgi:hypothetical protein
MNSSEARRLIGKEILWDVAIERHRSILGPSRGIVEDVSGKNILISGDWRWLPDIRNVSVLNEY